VSNIVQKVDRRVRRTHKLLGDALISLILEEGYEGITIKDITERADVAYVTFFRHYKSIDELLTQRLDEVISELTERLEASSVSGYDAANEGTIIFEHALENEGLYRVLLCSPGAFHVAQHLKQIVAGEALGECETTFRDNPGNLPLEIACHQYATSILGLIEWWLRNDMPYSPERMGEIYNQLEKSFFFSMVNRADETVEEMISGYLEHMPQLANHGL
jgi:AcrR family transcriptional regulator